MAGSNRPSDDETRLSTPGSTPGDTATVSSSSGWLSSSGAIDHGRFAPGTLLGGRYRIVGRLGRGGMGEVYRADDLKLGQPVALKFLPADVDRDPARLMQLHTEVRMARQVSHPNVCRVYDIDEVEGHTFLSMEYVDGEDLGTLLKRIGRFPVDRATELARQICAGLAAAHERGVIHRDLKPANVMLDGTGKVRITDFGLAGATGESVRAGTPAYMAPEQLAGAQVTAQSDIYALGLVLYELYTGQRAIDAKNVADLVRKREAGVAPPSHLVRDLDPAVDRAIMRCLERDPGDRPASALGVAAALPGGDPLAAALAAGETPSPEMVAASGSTSALAALPAAALFVFCLASLAALGLLADRVTVPGLVPLPKPVEVLADRAVQVTRSLGYTNAPGDTAYGFIADQSFFQYLTGNASKVPVERLRSGWPPVIVFWHRTSPIELLPAVMASRVSYSDPPHTISGMTSVRLDPEGRLVELYVVPPQVEEPAGPPPATDWARLFDAAGLDLATFTPVASTWTPRTHSDARAAWQGPLPGWPDISLRIEAASYRGKAVSFLVIAPWSRPARMRTISNEPNSGRILQALAVAAVVGILLAAAIIARHNLRMGRGDRRGAARLGWTIFVVNVIAWLVGATHSSNLTTDVNRFYAAAGLALWFGALTWILYVALEPYVRRFWPSTLVSWSRLMAGDWRDPKVGRDVLVACAVALGMTVFFWSYPLLLARLGYEPGPPRLGRLSDLNGLRTVVESLGSMVFNTAFNGLWCLFGLVVIKLIVRRVWATILVAVLFFTFTAARDMFDAGPFVLNLVISAVIISSIVFVMLRLGLLATLTFFFVNFCIGNAVLTLDPEKWFFPVSAFMLALTVALAAYGYYASRGGEPILGRRILD
jgi:serine/threonine-protein kinase